LAREADLRATEEGYVELAEEYPDLDTFLRGYLAAGPIVRATGRSENNLCATHSTNAYVH
jgi:hypothetical protein